MGDVVRALRREKGWTQEELGRKAGYKSGAGVSISRFETGQVEPSAKRLEGIAKALDLSLQALLALAVEGGTRTAPEGSGVANRRLELVRQELERRSQIVSVLGQEFNDAHDRAKHDFLLRFLDVAGRVDGADPVRFMIDDIGEVDDAAAEAAYSIEFTRFGVVQALAATSGDAALHAIEGADLAYPTFTAVVAGAAATAAGAVADPTLVMTRGLASALRVRGTPAQRKVAAASAVVLASAVAVDMIAALWKQQRNRKELQRQLDSTLDQAEADLAENQPNVEALEALLPEATELLEYIAVHAGHALNRWDAQLGPGPSLEEVDQRRYDDFVEIAAAQLAVASLDFEGLLDGRADQLNRAVELAQETLAQARSIVTSRV